MNIVYSRGQAVAEFLVAVPVLVLLLGWAIPQLKQALQQRIEMQQLNQLSLSQVGLRQGLGLPLSDENYWQQQLALELSAEQSLQLNQHQNYAFAQALRPVDFLVQHAAGLDMPTDNLWRAVIEQTGGGGDSAVLAYYRLSDDWSPRTVSHLEQRPRAISSGELLNNPVMHSVQRVFSVLPMGRELSPDQLEFGYIDTDVVPARALCEARKC